MHHEGSYALSYVSYVNTICVTSEGCSQAPLQGIFLTLLYNYKVQKLQKHKIRFSSTEMCILTYVFLNGEVLNHGSEHLKHLCYLVNFLLC